VVDSLYIRGNSHFSKHFIRNKLGFNILTPLKSSDFTFGINQLYATNYFERINYFLSPSQTAGHVTLTVEVSEKPLSNLSTGVNFSSFTGIGITAGWKSNKFPVNNAKGYVRFQIGKYPVYKAGLTYYLNNSQKSLATFETNGFVLDFPVFNNFKPVSQYRQGKFNLLLSLSQVTGKNSVFTAGSEFFYQTLEPRIQSTENIKGNNSGFETFGSWKYHTLNRNAFPESGQHMHIRLALIHNQNPSLKAWDANNQPLKLSALEIKIGTFLQVYARGESFIPLSEKMTQILKWQFGYNFNYSQYFINNFNVGGSHYFLEKQFDFAGLNEYELITSSAGTGAFGMQYSLGNNLYALALTNVGLYDFDLQRLPAVTYANNVILGAGLTLGYLSVLGPIELTFSYSPQTDKIIGYVNLGWAF